MSSVRSGRRRLDQVEKYRESGDFEFYGKKKTVPSRLRMSEKFRVEMTGEGISFRSRDGRGPSQLSKVGVREVG